MKRHGALVALAVSLALTVLLATLFPRVYLANDDVGFTEYLRKNTYTPWISSILVRPLSFAYQVAPDLPWYGLYQYALIVIIGAVLFHTCSELVDPRPGPGRNVTLYGALVLAASQAIVVVGITWTSVSIFASGTALAAFAAHALISQARGKPMSLSRALLYGLLFANGYMLRYQGLGGVLVSLAPLVAWTGWRFAKKRHLPRISAVVAFVAPFAIVLAVQGQIRVADTSDYWEVFNDQRGRIHGHVAFNYIDRLAPELLEQTGWTLEQYRDFVGWRFIDENDFPLENVQKLVATGGVPQPIEPRWAWGQLREIYQESTVSVYLFLLAVAAGVALAALGVLDRRSGVFSVGYLVFVTCSALWTASHFRFPQRVSIAYYAVAALGLFIYLAREIADRRAPSEVPLRGAPRVLLAQAVIAVLTFVWARNLVVWIDRDPWPNEAQLQALEDRIAARNAFVFVYVQSGQVHHDPLRTVPRSYEGLAGGWGTFSPSWYKTIARLGVHRGTDVFGAMVNNPEAYVLSAMGARPILEDWMRRKLRNPSIRLALVDAAAIPGGERPELYRVVTTPPVRGNEEWLARERLEHELAARLPGPPSVDDLTFTPIAFAAPYEPYIARLRTSVPLEPGGGTKVAPIDRGLRAEATGDSRDECARLSNNVDRAGIHVPIDGLGAARFEIKLLDPEHVMGLDVHAQTRTGRSIRWRWERYENTTFGFDGKFTLVPGYPSRQLQFAFSNARPADVTDLYIYAAVKPGTRAGFELRDLEVAQRKRP